ncbi:MAG TPA: competence/damage-inducible protein A [Acidimicrobiia bacterium]|nr:competence/damage-inducible protein A [Acidimicrobiia bacterium]
MIVEVLAVGTELLLGQIVNGNAATIGIALADSGFDAHYQTVVGDNLKRIVAAVRIAVERSDALIITGGIGPTQDDLTREAICAAFDLPMRSSETYAVFLRERFARWGRDMPASNLRQAEYPEGAEMLPNPKGTAPGLVLERDGKLIFVLPGVPEEMVNLLATEVLPRLRQAAGVEAVVRSRVLRSWGRSESQVAEMLDDLFTDRTNPSIAFLASGGEIKVRITAKAATVLDAEEMIAPVEAAVRERLHPSIFSVDGQTIEQVVQELVQSRNWTIGTAESATGGMVAARLTAIPGASAFYRGSVITYAADLKHSLLDVSDLSAGLVSEPTVLAMAQGARKRLEVDVAVAVAGSAGPEPLEQPVGTMVFAVVTPERSQARTIRYPGDRERVRTYATTGALHLVRLAVAGEWWSA